MNWLIDDFPFDLRSDLKAYGDLVEGVDFILTNAGTWSHCEATKQRLSEMRLGKKLGPQSPEHKAKRIAAMRGVKHTPERKAAISAAKKASPHTYTLGMKGKVRSAESRALQSKATKGRKKTDETRRRMSLAQTGKTISVESREKIAVALRGRKQPAEQTAKRLLKVAGSVWWNDGVLNRLAVTQPGPTFVRGRTRKTTCHTP